MLPRPHTALPLALPLPMLMVRAGRAARRCSTACLLAIALLLPPTLARAADATGAAAPVVAWVIPPAWQRSAPAAPLTPLQAGQALAPGHSLITGAGGSTAVRLDATRHVLLEERTTWSWTAADASQGNDGSGNVQIGEATVMRGEPRLPAPVADAGGLAPPRLVAGGTWRVRLLQTPAREAADTLLAELQRGGLPATLTHTEGATGTQAGTPWQVVLTGLAGIQDASNALRWLQARQAGLGEATIEAPFRASPVDAAMPDIVRALAPPESEPPAGGTETSQRATAACLQWGAFGATDLPRARRALATRLPGVPASERAAPTRAGWLVTLRPARNRKDAQAQLEDARRHGLRNATLIEDDPALRNTVSLGRYDTRERATRRLAEVKAAGQATARIQGTKSTPQTLLVLRDASPAQQAALAELRANFAGTAVSECAAGR